MTTEANEATEQVDNLKIITIVWDYSDDSIDVSWEGMDSMQAVGVLLSTLDVVRSGAAFDDEDEEDDG